MNSMLIGGGIVERTVVFSWCDPFQNGWKHPPDIIGNINAIPTGRFRIKGTLTRDGSPIAAAFHVHRRRDGLLLKAGMSDVSGQYEVTGLPGDDVYLVAIDPRNEYNAGILDRLKPEA